MGQLKCAVIIALLFLSSVFSLDELENYHLRLPVNASVSIPGYGDVIESGKTLSKNVLRQTQDVKEGLHQATLPWIEHFQEHPPFAQGAQLLLQLIERFKNQHKEVSKELYSLLELHGLGLIDDLEIRKLLIPFNITTTISTNSTEQTIEIGDLISKRVALKLPSLPRSPLLTTDPSKHFYYTPLTVEILPDGRLHQLMGSPQSSTPPYNKNKTSQGPGIMSPLEFPTMLLKRNNTSTVPNHYPKVNGPPLAILEELSRNRTRNKLADKSKKPSHQGPRRNESTVTIPLDMEPLRHPSTPPEEKNNRSQSPLQSNITLLPDEIPKGVPLVEKVKEDSLAPYVHPRIENHASPQHIPEKITEIKLTDSKKKHNLSEEDAQTLPDHLSQEKSQKSLTPIQFPPSHLSKHQNYSSVSHNIVNNTTYSSELLESHDSDYNDPFISKRQGEDIKEESPQQFTNGTLNSTPDSINKEGDMTSHFSSEKFQHPSVNLIDLVSRGASKSVTPHYPQVSNEASKDSNLLSDNYHTNSSTRRVPGIGIVPYNIKKPQESVNSAPSRTNAKSNYHPALLDVPLTQKYPNPENQNEKLHDIAFENDELIRNITKNIVQGPNLNNATQRDDTFTLPNKQQQRSESNIEHNKRKSQESYGYLTTENEDYLNDFEALRSEIPLQYKENHEQNPLPEAEKEEEVYKMPDNYVNKNYNYPSEKPSELYKDDFHIRDETGERNFQYEKDSNKVKIPMLVHLTQLPDNSSNVLGKHDSHKSHKTTIRTQPTENAHPQDRGINDIQSPGDKTAGNKTEKPGTGISPFSSNLISVDEKKANNENLLQITVPSNHNEKSQSAGDDNYSKPSITLSPATTNLNLRHGSNHLENTTLSEIEMNNDLKESNNNSTFRDFNEDSHMNNGRTDDSPINDEPHQSKSLPLERYSTAITPSNSTTVLISDPNKFLDQRLPLNPNQNALNDNRVFNPYIVSDVLPSQREDQPSSNPLPPADELMKFNDNHLGETINSVLNDTNRDHITLNEERSTYNTREKEKDIISPQKLEKDDKSNNPRSPRDDTTVKEKERDDNYANSEEQRTTIKEPTDLFGQKGEEMSSKSEEEFIKITEPLKNNTRKEEVISKEGDNDFHHPHISEDSSRNPVHDISQSSSHIFSNRGKDEHRLIDMSQDAHQSHYHVYDKSQGSLSTINLTSEITLDREFKRLPESHVSEISFATNTKHLVKDSPVAPYTSSKTQSPLKESDVHISDRKSQPAASRTKDGELGVELSQFPKNAVNNTLPFVDPNALAKDNLGHPFDQHTVDVTETSFEMPIIIEEAPRHNYDYSSDSEEYYDDIGIKEEVYKLATLKNNTGSTTMVTKPRNNLRPNETSNSLYSISPHVSLEPTALPTTVLPLNSQNATVTPGRIMQRRNPIVPIIIPQEQPMPPPESPELIKQSHEALRKWLSQYFPPGYLETHGWNAYLNSMRNTIYGQNDDFHSHPAGVQFTDDNLRKILDSNLFERIMDDDFVFHDIEDLGAYFNISSSTPYANSTNGDISLE